MATRRRTPEPPPIELKAFTPEDINQGMVKLRRRIAQVKALETEHVAYNDQRRYTAQEDIRTTILEVFGHNSPQYQTHQYHQIDQGGMYIGMSEHESQRNFLKGIPQTIRMLEGLIAWLEEKRTEWGQSSTTRVRAAFEGLDLHHRIASVCADLYRDGHYRNAVFDASVALVNFVKERSRRPNLDGAPLMRAVFSRNNPVLAFNDLKEQTDLDEQEGMMHLFEGAVLALRNPRAHALSNDSPEAALEYIVLLSFLAKRLEYTQRR